MQSDAREVLLFGTDVEDYRDGLFPTDVFVPLLDSKRQDPNVPDGVKRAVKLLLTESAVVIKFVNTDVMEPYWEGETPRYTAPCNLAFNDHGGGSESQFKILLNRHQPDADPTQQVLYSPPNADGSASNTTFHRSSLTFLDREPNGLEYEEAIPNSLKTGDAAQYYGRSEYDFFLFGNSSTPERFSQVFEQIGFKFEDTPYEGIKVVEFNALRDAAHERLSAEEYDHWPHDQFARQLAILNTIETTVKLN